MNLDSIKTRPVIFFEQTDMRAIALAESRNNGADAIIVNSAMIMENSCKTDVCYVLKKSSLQVVARTNKMAEIGKLITLDVTFFTGLSPKDAKQLKEEVYYYI